MQDIARVSADRFDLWSRLVHAFGSRQLCEIGVLEGAFAHALLSGAPHIERYYLVDPWRYLDGWNKPSNRSDAAFEEVYQRMLARTRPFAAKTVVLRDVSRMALKAIPDESLDFAYVDGDHTLRGICIDLVNLLPKVRRGGVIGGDDFTKNIWQHGMHYSPTEVFPFALYFAEAHGLKFVTLPFNQFCIVNDPEGGFELMDLAGYAGLDPIDIYGPPPGRD